MVLSFTLNLKMLENPGLSCTVGQLYRRKQLSIRQRARTFMNSPEISIQYEKKCDNIHRITTG